MIYETERGALFGKEYKKPACPFCGLTVDRPLDPPVRRHGDMPVGACACGAVYAYDITGHSLGSAFIEALVFGCDQDWDLAWSLSPGDDYAEELVKNYDAESHLIIPGGSFQGRRVSGALYFVRLHRDVREVTGRGVEKKLERARAAAPPPTSGATVSLTKKEVQDLVDRYQPEPILAAAGRDKRVLRDLQRLIYTGDHLTRSRAADILGQASAVVARWNQGTVSNLLQGLFSAVTSPGASSWGALESIGEIISRRPDLFAGYIPLLYNFLAHPDHRRGTAGALARIAQASPDLVRGAAYRLLPCLADPDPETRGYTARLMGYLGLAAAAEQLGRLKDDRAAVTVYRAGVLEEKTVGELAAEALGKIGLNKN